LTFVRLDGTYKNPANITVTIGIAAAVVASTASADQP